MMSNTTTEHELENVRLMNLEWEAWQLVCRALRDGSVTAEDLAAPLVKTRRNPTTKGQRILQTVMEWGDKLAALRVHQAKIKGE
jgi:hypothetical protein